MGAVYHSRRFLHVAAIKYAWHAYLHTCCTESVVDADTPKAFSSTTILVKCSQNNSCKTFQLDSLQMVFVVNYIHVSRWLPRSFLSRQEHAQEGADLSRQQKLSSIPSMGFLLFLTSFPGKMMKHVWSVCRLLNCGNELKKRQRSSRSWRCHGAVAYGCSSCGAVFMRGHDRTGFPSDWRCELQSSAVSVHLLCIQLEKRAILSSNHGLKEVSQQLCFAFFRGSSLYLFVFMRPCMWFDFGHCRARPNKKVSSIVWSL